MVDKALTFSEIEWKYLTISWDMVSFFPSAGVRISIRIGKEVIETNVNKRKRIRVARLFEILKPKMGDVLSIVKRAPDAYEAYLKC